MKIFSIFKSNILISTLCAVAMCACSSDNPVDTPMRLTDVDLDKTQLSIYLNDEWIENASVDFIEIPDNDSVAMILSGVNPTETIDLMVTTAHDDEGNIVFNGEISNDKSVLTANGIWKFDNNNTKASANSVKINISYRVTDWNLLRNYYVSFDGNRGLRHIRDIGTYPLAKVDIEGQRDSCEYICQVINKELANSLSSLSVNLGPSGDLTVKYTTPQLLEYEQQFRYWIRTEPMRKKNIIEVENPELFYDFLLDALDLSGNKYVPDSEVASIYLIADHDYRDTRIMILDDLHYRIFGYINNSFAEKGLWNIYDRRYITLMYMGANTAYVGVTNLVVYDHYRWCFSNRGVDE